MPRTNDVGLLLGAGADVNARDEDGKTPLDWTEEVTNALVAEGAEPIPFTIDRQGLQVTTL